MFLFVRCHDWMIALDAGGVERIIMAADTPARAVKDAPPGCLGLLACDGESFQRCAWDLGLVLGLEPLASAWVLMQTPAVAAARASDTSAVRRVPLALRTGSALSVGAFPSGQAWPLPAHATPARPGLFPAAFPASIVQARHRPAIPIGLKLDFTRLWKESELEFAARLLETVQFNPGILTPLSK